MLEKQSIRGKEWPSYVDGVRDVRQADSWSVRSHHAVLGRLPALTDVRAGTNGA